MKYKTLRLFKVARAAFAVLFFAVVGLAQVKPQSSYLSGMRDEVPGANDTVQNPLNDQEIMLSAGWNWISFYLECTPSLFEALESGIAASNGTALIKDMSYSTMLQSGSWSSSDLTFSNESMYMVNVPNATTVTLTAPKAEASNHPITLTPGWNWIGYPLSKAMPLNEALFGLTPSTGDLIKNMSGASSYNGTAWEGSLENMEPGLGYMYYNKDTEPKILVFPSTPLVQGVVEIPEGMDASNIIVTNFSEEVVPDEDGEFEIHAANMLMATNAENGKLVYFTMSSIAEYNQEGNRDANANDLNAKETAIFLTFRCLPFSLRKGPDSSFNTLKEIFYSLQCVKDLESTIQNVVSTYGYLKEDELTEAVNAVKAFLYEELGFVGEKRSCMMEPVQQVPREDGEVDLQAPYLPTDRMFGIYLSITESAHTDDPEQWTIHCTGMNGIPTTFGVVKGEVNQAMINGVWVDFDCDEDADIYFLPPAGLSDILDHVTDWDGVKEIFQEVRQKMQDSNSTFHADFYKAKTENMVFELPEPSLGNANALCILAPMDKTSVFIANCIFAIVDLVDFAIPSTMLDPLIKDFINDHDYVTMFQAQMNNGTEGMEIILNETVEKFFDLTWDVLKRGGIYQVSDLAQLLTGVNIITNCFDIVAEVYTALYVRSFAFPVHAEYTEPTMEFPDVVINSYSVEGSTATIVWSVNSVGSLSIWEQGICYSTSPDPYPSSATCVVAESTGVGTFESVIEDLELGQRYYVRAYANTWVEPLAGYSKVIWFDTSEEGSTFVINASADPQEGGTVSGGGAYAMNAECTLTATPAQGYVFSHWTEDGVMAYPEATYTFTVTSSRTLVANFDLDGGGNTVDGVLPGAFTVNGNGDQVYFSQGNLQYQASTNTWRFAENQWDYVGDANANISNSYDGWIDLFGWGTSGFNHGAVCYQPWSTSTNSDHYFAYGQESYSLYNQTGKADWGYNAISNGGNAENSGWSTLKIEECYYLFNTRSTASGIRYAKANVNNVNGVILLPDTWSADTYSLSNTNESGAVFSSNTISGGQWSVLEQAGAVFLPAAGERYGSSIYAAGSAGCYWLASYYNGSFVCLGAFDDSDLYFGGTNRCIGQSVRLVRSSPSAFIVINAISNPEEGGSVSGTGAYEAGAECTLIAMPAAGYAFSHWTEDGVTVSTEATYSFTVTSSRTLVANFVVGGSGNVGEGALNGAFSVNANGDQVYFSQGNLQYQASTDTWRFAENQWDYVGYGTYGTVYEGAVKSDNELISSTYGGWIDLFGWGTSGYNHGANCYQPWSTSDNHSDYYAYGAYNNNLYNQSGQADWGYNAISNGGNQAGLWRTLTQSEWDYVFYTRNTVSGFRYVSASVNNVNGVILLPDTWSADTYNLNYSNENGTNYSNNTLTGVQWSVLEQAGAVFLPAAGNRLETWAGGIGWLGDYWSASCDNSHCAWCVVFDDGINADHIVTDCEGERNYGSSVRLVRTAE